ncbi:anaerobic C4-dicarboxylate transporter family protein [Rhodococcus sp. IEGM 1409]|uniref:anaerobic C4-dicarboxylate transporter family protein n=1 Tax=Rhodococcus sp. IEGM 1409 TaxID=3047082 RepID=UPI0024B81289|nr:anaerobic C4-dicarboxylate transporter family protein [Rhodococcus sp. IEGM 1409]MDI9899620.1 anaerobic C4-dicarboxylate transporter family protein [Rhodococcus sp. IEGM 1409]
MPVRPTSATRCFPFIYDVSYMNGVRPSQPLSLSVVSTGVALACSPGSAAMAAMVTLTDVAPVTGLSPRRLPS